MGHTTVHQAVGGPGFQPGMPNSYAQGQGGRSLHRGQGIQHDNANNASRLLIDGQMLEAVDSKPAEQGNRNQEGSAGQSRSSSLGSASESERRICASAPHDVDDNGNHKIDGENYSHSSSSDEADLPVGGDDHSVEQLEALSREQSGLKPVTDQVEPKSAIQQVYQGNGRNSPAVDLAGRRESAADGAYHDIGKDLSRTSSMGSEVLSTAENNGDNTRGTGSPFVDEGRRSSQTPDHSGVKKSGAGWYVSLGLAVGMATVFVCGGLWVLTASRRDQSEESFGSFRVKYPICYPHERPSELMSATGIAWFWFASTVGPLILMWMCFRSRKVKMTATMAEAAEAKIPGISHWRCKIGSKDPGDIVEGPADRIINVLKTSGSISRCPFCFDVYKDHMKAGHSRVTRLPENTTFEVFPFNDGQDEHLMVSKFVRINSRVALYAGDLIYSIDSVPVKSVGLREAIRLVSSGKSKELVLDHYHQIAGWLSEQTDNR